jgi:hypothetical protein
MTGRSPRLPDAVKDVAVGINAHVDVGHDQIVEVAVSLVGEEQIRHPDLLRVGQRQIFDLAFTKGTARQSQNFGSFLFHLIFFVLLSSSGSE